MIVVQYYLDGFGGYQRYSYILLHVHAHTIIVSIHVLNTAPTPYNNDMKHENCIASSLRRMAQNIKIHYNKFKLQELILLILILMLSIIK